VNAHNFVTVLVGPRNAWAQPMQICLPTKINYEHIATSSKLWPRPAKRDETAKSLLPR